MEKDHAFQKLMGKLGDFGRYQQYQFILHVLAALPTGMHMLSLVTIAGIPQHRCAIDGVDNSTHTEPWNSTLVHDKIPMNKYGQLDSCHVYTSNGTMKRCSSWIYDTQYYTSSRGIEWDFVCDRRWMAALAQTVFMTGVVIGSLLLGPLCDKFGRRTIYLWASLLQLTFGIITSFMTQYYWFIGFRFLFGIFAISPFKAGYVLTIETVGPSKRAFCSAWFQILFGTGVMLVGLWGYAVDNVMYLQLIYAMHSTLMLPHWFLMDESPRWLWSQGRIDETVAIVNKALKMNKSRESVNLPLLVSSESVKETSPDGSLPGVTSLFRTPNMCKRTITVFTIWFAVGLVYYGLALNTGKLNGNPFLLLTLNGFVELPGYTLGMYIVYKIGHRSVLCVTMFLSGISCIVVVFLPDGSTLTTVSAMAGKLVISGAFAIIYKYSAELFPTVVRSSAVGLGTMCASLSAAVAPLINLLDSFNPTVPTLVFGVFALFSSMCTVMLPETKGRLLPQTVEDGENFGLGDTCFTNCSGRRVSTESIETIEPLKCNRKEI